MECAAITSNTLLTDLQSKAKTNPNMKTFILSFVVLICARAFAGTNDLTIALPGKETKISLKELKTKLKVVSVTIDDPVYKKEKSYEGFYLTEVLKLAGAEQSTSGEEIVFTAVDGYSPNTSFANVHKYTGVLVFKEKGKKDFEFTKVAQGKTMITMAPYYLVWKEGKKLVEGVPWPYQLVKIEVVDFKQKYSKLYPKDVESDSRVMKGFLLFKNQCLRCHSINLEGGDLGPELNAPKNITEYWSRRVLKEFIHDAPSFRYKSKMPPFTFLKENEIDEIVRYLKHMKGQKIIL